MINNQFLYLFVYGTLRPDLASHPRCPVLSYRFKHCKYLPATIKVERRLVTTSKTRFPFLIPSDKLTEVPGNLIFIDTSDDSDIFSLEGVTKMEFGCLYYLAPVIAHTNEGDYAAFTFFHEGDGLKEKDMIPIDDYKEYLYGKEWNG